MPGATSTLESGTVAAPIATLPGGGIVLRGAWTFASRDLVIDGCQSGHTEGAPTGNGAFDYTAGGWRVVSRDWSQHTCRLVATAREAPACAAAGVSAPCLPSRLRSIAHAIDIPITVGELRAGLTGGIEVEVIAPCDAAVIAPARAGWLETHGVAVAAVVGMLMALAWFARVRIRSARTAEGRVAREVRALCARLRRADAVHRRLGPLVASMRVQADRLARLRDDLRRRAAHAGPSALRARRDELARCATAESAEARALVERQIERVEAWEREAEVASDRIECLLEALRAVALRVSDAEAGALRRAVVDDTVADELEIEVQVATEALAEMDAMA